MHREGLQEPHLDAYMVESCGGFALVRFGLSVENAAWMCTTP
jgi:hypothetical protein